tara:strand:+ start:715 stop:1089 length:375 start_codon:yes stop_codon:yes gene_type:complete
MLINGYGILSILLYTIWNIWVLTDRIKRNEIRNYLPGFVFDIVYFVSMLYLLATSNINFLLIGTLYIILHVIFGGLIVLFKPEIDTKKMRSSEVMKNYWTYVTIDGSITLISFLIMILAGAGNG